METTYQWIWWLMVIVIIILLMGFYDWMSNFEINLCLCFLIILVAIGCLYFVNWNNNNGSNGPLNAPISANQVGYYSSYQPADNTFYKNSLVNISYYCSKDQLKGSLNNLSILPGNSYSNGIINITTSLSKCNHYIIEVKNNYTSSLSITVTPVYSFPTNVNTVNYIRIRN